MGEMSVASATHGRRMGKSYRGAVGLVVRIGMDVKLRKGVRGGRRDGRTAPRFRMLCAYHVGLAKLARPMAIHGEPSGFDECALATLTR